MFLIEKLPAESQVDTYAYLESLIIECYGKSPEWLHFELRDRYRFGGREFIQMFCPYGSVHCKLSMHATKGDGIARDILMLGEKANKPIALLLHHGKESEYDHRKVESVG